MSSDVTIWCDGQWPAKPMYAKHCQQVYLRQVGALWPNTAYARERAR